MMTLRIYIYIYNMTRLRLKVTLCFDWRRIERSTL